MKKTLYLIINILLILLKKQPRFIDQPKRHFKAIAISWVVVSILYFFILQAESVLRPLYNWINLKTDTFISINAGVDSKVFNGINVPPLELYDIDDATYRSWNFPATVPRNKLTKLISRAVDGGAYVIAVDIDLTFSGDEFEDDTLGKYLQSLNESNDPDAPIIILTRRLLRPLDNNNQVDLKTIFTMPVSFLDKYIPLQKNIYWSSTMFSVDEDHVVRRWRQAEVYCDKDFKFKIIPSFQLVSAIAFISKLKKLNPQNELKLLNDKLSELLMDRNCSLSDRIPSLKAFISLDLIKSTFEINIDKNLKLDLKSFGESERIRYRLSPEGKSDFKNQIVNTSASLIQTSQVKLDVFGRLVLIGATFQESNDFHMSPISKSPIPGVFVLANAIDSMFTTQEDSVIFYFIGSLLILILLIVGAFLAERQSTFLWIIVSSLIFFLIGLVVYSPGSSAAALPFSVVLVGIWYSFLNLLNSFFGDKNALQ